MINRSIRWAVLIGAIVTIPLVQVVANAKSAPEINQIAQSITVKIEATGSQGSGVILQRQGDIYTVLTAAHVVKARNATFSLVTPDAKKYKVIANSIRIPTQDIDLAIVKFQASVNYPVAKLGNSNPLSGGSELYVGGFPAPTGLITESIFVFRPGTVSANSNKILKEGYSLLYSNETLPGMSGGAVLNSAGELVAIHGKGDREQSSDGTFSGPKTGYNAGITINLFGTIATSLGVDLEGKVADIPKNAAPKADDYYALAVQKETRDRDYQGALAELNRAIQLDPNFAKAYNRRGNLKSSKLKDQQGALADYNRAIQLNSNFAEAYSDRGAFKYRKLKDLQGALADFNRAIQVDPNYAEAYNNRGYLKRYDFKDIQGALADFNRAIQVDPNYVAVYINRGQLKDIHLKDPQGALADFNSAIQINPKHVNAKIAYTDRGTLKYEKLNDVQGALADFNRAIQVDPNYVNAYNDRGKLKYQKLNDVQGAIADFSRAIQVDPNYGDAYYNRGYVKYVALKDRPSAIADIQTAAKLFREQNEKTKYNQAIGSLREWGMTEKN